MRSEALLSDDQIRPGFNLIRLLLALPLAKDAKHRQTHVASFLSLLRPEWRDLHSAGVGTFGISAEKRKVGPYTRRAPGSKISPLARCGGVVVLAELGLRTAAACGVSNIEMDVSVQQGSLRRVRANVDGQFPGMFSALDEYVAGKV